MATESVELACLVGEPLWMVLVVNVEVDLLRLACSYLQLVHLPLVVSDEFVLLTEPSLILFV